MPTNVRIQLSPHQASNAASTEMNETASKSPQKPSLPAASASDHSAGRPEARVCQPGTVGSRVETGSGSQECSVDTARDTAQTLAGSIVNVAAYKFAALDQLETRRTQLRNRCLELDLRGTILLSHEGINLFMAGRREPIDTFLDELRCEAEFSDLEVKESYSDKVPFRRMLVRLKKEIIPFGKAGIEPAAKTSPKLPAVELKQWLDSGRSVRLLDVRNDYEVDLGTFAGAEKLGLGHFRDFPEAIRQLPESAKREPLVMFCTGGIRCEKAGPLMEQAGFEQVYQLDGGILKYFEQCGGAHYDGACFVFDGRVALDSSLKPTGNLLCFNCQSVLTAEHVASGKFRFGEYCPSCYIEPQKLAESQLERRRAKIRELADKQPGATPYDHVRKIHVPGKLAGLPLLDFLEQYQPAIGREQWSRWLEAGQITGETVCSARQIVREGQRFLHHLPDTVEPRINPQIELLYEDASLVVVNKPAPLPCHPSGRFNRNTLTSILAGAYPNEKLRLAHRLDASTTGVVLLCRKYRPAQLVQPQFSQHTVDKVYLARVHGHCPQGNFQCDASISDGPHSTGGGRKIDPDGLSALTEFSTLAHFADGTSLVQARPRTGRTHQIRLHLWHLGFPIVRDPLYRREGELSDAKQSRKLPGQNGHSSETLETQIGGMQLHSHQLSLIHPDSGQRVTFEGHSPAWATESAAE